MGRMEICLRLSVKRIFYMVELQMRFLHVHSIAGLKMVHFLMTNGQISLKQFWKDNGKTFPKEGE